MVFSTATSTTPSSPFYSPLMATPASPFYSPLGAGRRLRSASSSSTALSNLPMLVAAFLAVLATGGPTYSFGVYANTLKQQLDLTQSELDTLGAASFAAGLLSWIPGLCVDAWGSRMALLVGGTLQSLGLACYWCVVRWNWYLLLPQALWVPLLSCLSIIIFTSNNLVIGGVFKAIVVSCELGTKGKAVGAGKAYLGLGAGVYACLFRSIRHDGDSDLDFLAMSAVVVLGAIVLPAALGLPTQAALAKHGTRDASTNRHYTILYIGLALLALVVVGSSAAFMFRPLPQQPMSDDDVDAAAEEEATTTIVSQWIKGVAILVLWVGPVVSLLCIPNQKRKKASLYHSSVRRKLRQDMNQATPVIVNERMRLVDLSSRNPQEEEEEDLSNVCETPQPVPDVTLTEMLRTGTAWLFLLPSTILVGAGTMLTTNMGQMVQSRALPPRAAAACLALFSVAQAVARVASGSVSESALQWRRMGGCFGLETGGVPRTAFLVLCCAFSVAGHGLLAMTESSRALFVTGVMLTGVSFGALWPLMVLIVGDLFGTVNHGANYMFADGFTCAVGTLSLAKFLTQSVYEQHLVDDEKDNVGKSCLGPDCFRSTHIIISGLCLVSLFACVALLYRTRSSYGTLRE